MSLSGTMPTFTSCTKFLGSPGIITTVRIIALEFPGHECIYDLTTERVFGSKATWVIDVLGLYFYDVFSMGVCTLADVRSAGAGITCMYCTFF